MNAVVRVRPRSSVVSVSYTHLDPAKFVAAALSPAVATGVQVISEKNQTAIAFIHDDQLSLAIGKEGQNARLAAKLTG